MTRAPAEAPPSEVTERSQQERLASATVIRVFFISVLLVSAVAANLSEADTDSQERSVLVGLILFTFIAAIAHWVWNRTGWRPRTLVYVQMVGDLLTATGLVLVTGAMDSVFPFLFFIVILQGANMLGRRGALVAAAGATAAMLLVQVVDALALPFLATHLPSLAQAHPDPPVYPIAMHVVAFFAVAYLSGYLAQMLGRADSELAKRDVDLRELQAMNDSIVRSIQSGLISTDREGRVIFFNEAAERISGVAKSAVVGEVLGEVIPQLGGLLQPANDSGSLWRRPEVTISRADSSEVVLGISVSDLTNESGHRSGSLLIFQDLTEIRKLEVAVKRQEHLAAIGELSAAIAHEIRNPLAAISGSAQTLEMLLEGGADEAELLRIVVHEADRLNGLINEFLEFARPVRSTLQTMLLSEVVNPTLTAFSGSVEHEVRSTCKDAPILVNVDPRKLQQVLWNILNNAGDAQDGPGTILVCTSHVRHEGREWAELVVEDSGPGFSEEHLARVFDPFFTTKDHGTGLGLAISHRIVTDHGGLMRAENRPEGGGRVSVLLPVYGGRETMRRVREAMS